MLQKVKRAGCPGVRFDFSGCLWRRHEPHATLDWQNEILQVARVRNSDRLRIKKQPKFTAHLRVIFWISDRIWYKDRGSQKYSLIIVGITGHWLKAMKKSKMLSSSFDETHAMGTIKTRMTRQGWQKRLNRARNEKADAINISKTKGTTWKKPLLLVSGAWGNRIKNNQIGFGVKPLGHHMINGENEMLHANKLAKHEND